MITAQDVWPIIGMPVLAAVPVLDYALGVSRRLARLPGLRRPDLILLVLMLMAWWLVMMLAAPNPTTIEIRDYATAAGARQDIAEKRAHWNAVAPYFYSAAAVLVLSEITALWMAARQKRSLLIWFFIALMGNAGAIVWLFCDRRRSASPVTA